LDLNGGYFSGGYLHTCRVSTVSNHLQEAWKIPSLARIMVSNYFESLLTKTTHDMVCDFFKFVLQSGFEKLFFEIILLSK
jgi:hypothetical protein